MRFYSACLAIAVAAWLSVGASPALALPEASEQETDAALVGTFPELRVVRNTLDNNLRLVLEEDHSSPTVAVCITYGVGAEDDELDRAGTAHLIELLMFEGSANVPPGAHSRWIAERGGSVTSITKSDTTSFCQTLRSSDLELALWLEADRMKKLLITSESFESRRRIALEHAEAEAEGPEVGSGKLTALVFQGYWPYAHSIIGTRAALESARVEEVRKLHWRHYVPNNAVLSVVGDFDGNGALALIKRYFGELPARVPGTSSDPVSKLPQQTSERLDVTIDKRNQTPTVYFGWRIPPRRSKEHRALELGAAILAGGESSRLYQSLVKDRGSALVTSAWTLGHVGPDLLGMKISIAPSSTVDKVQAVLDGELNRLRLTGPSEAELRKAKARVRIELLKSIETHEGRARLLGEREASGRDANSVNDDLNAFLAVSVDDVRRAAAEYLQDHLRSIVEVYPPGWAQDEPSLVERRSHQVKAGETLTTIAKRHGSSVEEIAHASNIDPKKPIRTGQRLTVPITGAAVPVKQSALARTHTVKAGDSLSAIAHRYRTSIGKIVEFNKLDPKKQIIVGQKLLIPPLPPDDESPAPTSSPKKPAAKKPAKPAKK